MSFNTIFSLMNVTIALVNCAVAFNNLRIAKRNHKLFLQTIVKKCLGFGTGCDGCAECEP